MRRQRRRDLRPQSLRARLTVAVGVVLVSAFAITYVAVYNGAGDALRSQDDKELATAARAFARVLAPQHTTQQIDAEAARYVATQPFQSSSRLLFMSQVGYPTRSNQPELLGSGPDDGESSADQRSENALARRLLAARPGFSSVQAPDSGHLRLYVISLPRNVRIGAGESLEPVSRAEIQIRHEFLLGGGLTLAAALLAASLIAAGFTRPLSRMARIAARVDGGDLSHRIERRGPHDEIRVLADAFDNMLDRLEDAFARQRAFVSDASHELRTPLTAIRGQLEVLARNPAPDAADVARVQRLVDAEVMRMTRLSEDLLLLAHTEEDRFVRREPIPTQEFLRELVESLQPGSDRTLSLHGEPPDGILHADPDRLAQALRNLLRNAIEHTAPGGRIELGAARNGRDHLRVWVEDDGPGIPLEHRDLVFDRLHRVHPDRGRSSGGTGLGLAIVKAIVEAHGGRVWATSGALGGARIELELPGFRALSLRAS